MVAAYLGFDTIVDLQRFVIMWPCLEAIRLICALPGETSDSLIFPSTIEASQALESNTRVRWSLVNTLKSPSPSTMPLTRLLNAWGLMKPSVITKVSTSMSMGRGNRQIFLRCRRHLAVPLSAPLTALPPAIVHLQA